MAEIWCGAVSECSYGSSGSRTARKRRMELRRMRVDPAAKHPRLNCSPNSPDFCGTEKDGSESQGSSSSEKEIQSIVNPQISAEGRNKDFLPKFGVASICGRRRGMEDAVSIHPSFCRREDAAAAAADLHYFGVFHGRGSPRVATKCKEKFHEIVKEELLLDEEGGEIRNSGTWWKRVMNRSFTRLDGNVASSSAVVAVVTPSKTVVASCGDSKALLCRNGKAVPLSADLSGELHRIQTSAGRVIYSEPDLTIEERSEEDECLILASHGLWDVVSNNAACVVAQMCLTEALLVPASSDADSENACSYASMQLTKLALARKSTGNVTVVVVDLRRF